MTFRFRQHSTARAFFALIGVTCLTSVMTFAQQAPRYVSPLSGAKPQPLQLPVAKPITPDATVVEDIIVRVNDQVISHSDLDRAEAQLQQEVQQNGGGPADLEQRRKDLLRDLIDQQLLLSKGKELNINADAEVIRRLDEIRKQNHWDNMEDLEKAARQQGVNFEDFKASIRNNIITSSVVRDEVGRNLHLTHNDEMKYYEAHKAQFEQPEQVRLSEILIATPGDSPTDAQIAAAKQKADSIAARLATGAKFDELAKAESNGPTAAQGGDLGDFKRGALAPILEQKTFVLQAGQNTEPIRTRQGYVILKVNSRTQAGVPPLEQVEQQVQEAMYGELMAPALRAYLTKLREDAFVDIRPGYVDSGASPRQSKPVFTAYTPPAPKKKLVEKQRFDNKGRMATTGTATAKPATLALDKNGKPKKVRREKVRYGQAPRNALPPAPDTATAATGTEAAPGTAIAPIVPSDEQAQADTNPLAAAAAKPAVKTRLTAREKEFEQKKADQKAAFEKEKLAAMPAAPTVDETQAKQVQSAPLGLNGDTVKKKKVKRKKGDEKQRIQTAPQAPSETQKQIVDQRNSDGTYKSPIPPKSSDQTTLPPNNTAPPGTPNPTPSTQPPPPNTQPTQPQN